MTGLVLEGGTFRGIFSAGVMDAFIEEGIEFPYIVGVSAGISNGASYVSKQFARNIDILEKYRNDKRYIGMRNYKKCRSMFGLDFVFGEIPQKLVPFDYETFKNYGGTCLVGVTNAETGKAEFKNILDDDENFMSLRATCAIPGYFPAIE
ncbi:MAG: patatin family protein, partial [Oscillospiraceae bacterium]|nr:patatin family protein [Oscillospiraceae bacterium]